VNPSETEKDRLVGQCCKYSQEWVTCVIVILDAKSLSYIEVIRFDLDDEDAEEEDEGEYEDDDEDDED
jgi:hypothetical protein